MLAAVPDPRARGGGAGAARPWGLVMVGKGCPAAGSLRAAAAVREAELPRLRLGSAVSTAASGGSSCPETPDRQPPPGRGCSASAYRHRTLGGLVGPRVVPRPHLLLPIPVPSALPQGRGDLRQPEPSAGARRVAAKPGGAGPCTHAVCTYVPTPGRLQGEVPCTAPYRSRVP